MWKYWLTERFNFIVKNLTCVTQTPAWTAEHVPGRHLEGIDATAPQDITEWTAQVNINNTDTPINLNPDCNERGWLLLYKSLTPTRKADYI